MCVSSWVSVIHRPLWRNLEKYRIRTWVLAPGWIPGCVIQLRISATRGAVLHCSLYWQIGKVSFLLYQMCRDKSIRKVKCWKIAYNSQQVQEFISSYSCLDRILNSTNRPIQSLSGFISSWVKGLQQETNRPSQSSTKAKNELSYNFSTPYVSGPKDRALKMYHHYHYHFEPLSSLEHSARLHPVFTSLDFAAILQSNVVSLESNPQSGGPGLCIYVPQWQGGPVIHPGTGFHFLRPYDS
jgi:hypothetical protein